MKLRSVLLSAMILFTTCLADARAFVQSSGLIFMPEEAREKLTQIQSFDALKWSFLVIEYTHELNDEAWAHAKSVCHKLQEYDVLAICDEDLKPFYPMLDGWLKDSTKRVSRTTDSILNSESNVAYGRGNMPMDKSLLTLLRKDPLGQMDALKNLLQDQQALSLERVGPLFFDNASHRILVPVYFDSSDKNHDRNKKAVVAVLKEFDTKNTHLTFMGYVGSALENENRVNDDLMNVGWISAILMIGLLAFLVLTKRGYVLYSLIPVLIGTLIGTVVIILFYGSIHGITLSFGPGIIGLAFDYALHSAFKQDDKHHVWRNNLIGLLTSIVVFILMFWSELPLLKELSIFSCVGLVVSFALLWLEHKRKGHTRKMLPMKITFQYKNLLVPISLILLAIGIAAPFVMKPTLDMHVVNYQSAQTLEIHKWFYGLRNNIAPLFQLSPTEDLENAKLHEGYQWSKATGIYAEGPAKYLPTPKDQVENLKSWCAKPVTFHDESKNKFFKPFIESINCDNIIYQPLVNTAAVPEYLSKFYNEESWLTVWSPSTDKEENAIRAQFGKHVISLAEIAQLFPQILLKEIRWILPLTILISFIILLLSLRNFKLSILSLIPFFTGIGLYALMTACMDVPVTFIALIGLLIVYGFSLDYGIFMVGSPNAEDDHELNSALLICFLTTLFGFLPLMFCKHPVLLQLGISLTAGSIGTFIGAVYCIPALQNFRIRANKVTKATISIILLIFLFTVDTFYAGTARPPELQKTSDINAGRWLDKEKYGLNHLILSGNDLERGLAAGQLTKHLLDKQERILIDQLESFISNDFMLQLSTLTLMNVFRGLENYIDSNFKNEMYGVAYSTNKKYGYFADGYTRQIAYHALHEAGQLMVDQGFEGFGCTVALLPFKNTWVLGRNFDFEGGSIFDEEKIVKWVFPDKGYKYVSVIWSGMVGAVTGVNEHGIYISINAAGSEDFRRIGTPLTLVAVKALQFAKNAEEALQILKNSKMIISDIFALVSAREGKAYRIEKSAEQIFIEDLSQPTLMANHLISEAFKSDTINEYRKTNLTSQTREARGQDLLNKMGELKILTDASAEDKVLSVIRDKGFQNGKSLYLGNRAAIDALIATHSVVFNGNTETLFVSRGPALAGEYMGFDLKKSFSQEAPVLSRILPADTAVTPERLTEIRATLKKIGRIDHLLKKQKCANAELLFSKISPLEASEYYLTQGKILECSGKSAEAKASYEKSLALYPPYKRNRDFLNEKINGR